MSQVLDAPGHPDSVPSPVSKSVVVVLGVHRGGTSALTRGLRALGIDLGDNLIPAKSDNPTGFWEDLDLCGINEKLLQSLHSSYEDVSLVDTRIPSNPTVDALRHRAAFLIRNKFASSTVWGFKDPRTARLLPFWQSVFSQLGIEVSYVIVVRHPISVARSLSTRNGFDPEKSYLLWLEHLIPAVSRTHGKKRVVVDYDLLMDRPTRELERVAMKLGLPITEESRKEIAHYSREFLVPSLRHTEYQVQDLNVDPALPRIAAASYEMLRQMATDSLDPDSPSVQQAWDRLESSLRDMEPVCRLAAAFEARLLLATLDLEADGAKPSQPDEQAGSPSPRVLDQDMHIGRLRRTTDEQLRPVSTGVLDKDRQIAGLQIAVANMSTRLRDAQSELEVHARSHENALNELRSELHDARSELEVRTKNHEEVLTELRSELHNARSELEVRTKNHEDVLTALRSELNGQLSQLSQFTGTLRAHAAALQETVDAIRGSTSWRITAPLRAARQGLERATYAGRGWLSRVARAAYRMAPLSIDQKLRVKNGLFRTLPSVFGHTVAYRDWEAFNLRLSAGSATVSIENESAMKIKAQWFAGAPEQSPRERSELSATIDGEICLESRPDLTQAGVAAAEHYAKDRRFEARPTAQSGLNIPPDHDLDAGKKSVLVVSHDASRTGAPILSLNLVQSLAERYNVVVLLLGPGGLLEAFESAAAEVIFKPAICGNQQLADDVISEICRRHKLLFALVNSIESRIVLPALALQFVPAVSLFHEFASYTRPRHAFREAFLWSAETVFSTRLTLDNALAEYPDLNNCSAVVVPQGRCLVPGEDIAEDDVEAERMRLAREIRPGGQFDDAVVVLGAGFVQLRKGVDLFLECASRVVHAPGGEKCRFVWIGKGYDPDDDVGYSVYLADQIRRAGLERHVVFTGETSAIESAYQAADMFLLSSRLDPLPNVAIDAMTHGLPIVCFDKTTGIAEFLRENALGDHCVADYLDTFEASRKVLAMAQSAELRETVGDRCRTASITKFHMQDYVSRLESLAISARDRMDQERLDMQDILKSGLFQKAFSIRRDFQWIPETLAIRGYIRSWKTGIGRRKPHPGFHPGIYLERHGLANTNSDPFADYLRHGQPQGPWNYTVISSQTAPKCSAPDGVRVALHLHAYFPALLPPIVERLNLNNIRPDLFLSVRDEGSRKSVLGMLGGYKGRIVQIETVPNRGRDIGPFLTAFGRQLVEGYDIVGHVHTKKSIVIKDTVESATWYSFLLDNLLGGPAGGRMADAILAAMTNDPSIGIVCPDDPNVIGWGANRSFAESIASRLGLSQLPDAFIFPVGTMFWIRASVLARFVDLGLSWDDYPDEPLPYDGSMLHALERLFGLALPYDGTRCATTHVAGETR